MPTVMFTCAMVGVITTATPRVSAQVITQIIDSTGDGVGNNLDAPLGIAVDASGNVYVTGVLTNNAFKITTGGVITQIIDAAGDGTGNILSGPIGIAVDGAGNVYVTGRDSDNAFKITPGGVITQIIDATGDGSGNMNAPFAIAVDAAGNVYMTGNLSHNAFKITPGGVITEIIDGFGDGVGNNLLSPVDIAVDVVGNVYVTGFSTHNAFKITPGGVITELIDATGDGAGNSLTNPFNIAVDAVGNVYVTGRNSHNAFKITPGGVITQIIDHAGDGAGNTFLVAEGIPVDAAGNVYVTGVNSHNAFQITPGGVITQIIDATGDGAGNTLNNPRGITVDSFGNVYMTGFNSDNVFKIVVDCNSNGLLDNCDLSCGALGSPCDLPGCGDSTDCNGNGIPDECDVASGMSLDCNGNFFPDECESDCNGNGIPDECDVIDGTSLDCNFNFFPDECEADCNSNGFPDDCDVMDGTSPDCNSNFFPDECEPDCNGNGLPDDCDIDVTSSTPGGPFFCTLACDPDCNNNGVPDACDISTGTSMDFDGNGVPDECDVWVGAVPNENAVAANNNWSTGANWLDNTVPTVGDKVVIDGNLAVQAIVDLDIPVTVDLLRLRNNATLNVTGSAGEDLTIATDGGLILAGPEVGMPQASLLVANDRSVSVLNGPVVLNATALYEALPGSTNVTASLSADAIEIREGFPAGGMVLTDSMSVCTTGDFTFRYEPVKHTLPPAPCDMVRSGTRGGVITRPRLHADNSASIGVGGDLVIFGGADVTVGPGVSFVVGGSIVNDATVCPEEFDLSKATVIMGPTGPCPSVAQTHSFRSPRSFEAAGQDLGANVLGFTNNFAVGGLAVAPGADVSFVDLFDNNADGATDALYVGNLVFDTGSVITIDNSKVFYNALTNNATSVMLLGTGELTAIPTGTAAPPLAASTYPHAVAKNRYLSFVPNPGNIAVPHTYQITHVGSGQSFFISPPRTTPAQIAGLGYTFVVSDTDPVGLLFDYGAEPIIHVGGCLIAPGESYEVRATTDGVNFSAPLTVTTASLPTNGRFWADAVGVFSTAGDQSTTPSTPAGAWTPPDGIMNGFDVTAALRGFQKMGQPDNTWTDLNDVNQDRLTNGNDILRFVNAFSTGSGKEFYPFPTPATCTAGPGMDIPPEAELAS